MQISKRGIGLVVRRLKLISGLAGTVLLVSPYLAMAQTAVEPAKKITIGNNGVYPTYYSLYAAADRGHFKQTGIDVELLGMKDDSTCLRALIGGSIDGCVVNVDGAIRVAQGGQNIKIVASITDPPVNSINVAPDIKSYADLKGKNIAVFGTEEGSTVAILYLLAQNGVSPKDLTLLTVGGSSERLAALKAKQVSAAVTVAPGSYQASDQGLPLLGSADVNNFVLVTIPGRSAAVDAALHKVIPIIDKTARSIMDPANKDQVIADMQRLFKMSPVHAARFYDEYVVEAKFLKNGAVPQAASVKRVADLVNTYTTTKVKIDPTSLIDTRFLK
ncbi:MAG: ABC transporter substrate-binding protein [Pseudolabrys sp.]